MDSLPTVFLSHGAPDLPIRDSAASDFLRSLYQQFPKPKAILMISAHWQSEPLRVSAATNPRTIYDFSGFPSKLYDLTYPASGSPELSDRVVKLLTQAGISCEMHPTRGLDHGAWTPLFLAYPAADIPVTQLSLQSYSDPLDHWQIGKALAPLRHEGVLIIGSGSATHNMYAFNESYNAEPPDWVRVFDRWLAQNITEGNQEVLLQYRQRAPYAKENHPTDEHLMPLFVAMGAGGVRGKQLHSSYIYGVFSMAAYAFAS